VALCSLGLASNVHSTSPASMEPELHGVSVAMRVMPSARVHEQPYDDAPPPLQDSGVDWLLDDVQATSKPASPVTTTCFASMFKASSSVIAPSNHSAVSSKHTTKATTSQRPYRGARMP
jgi:hypothetical protein